jgi:putative membrane protein
MSAEIPTTPGEKLHGLSWLFVMIAQILSNIFPIAVLLVAGSSKNDSDWELYLAGAGIIFVTAYSLFYTLTFRFWVETNEIIVKEGLFDRTLRHVPFHRIANVAFKQNVLHRIFNVVEISLESGAGIKPEAKMTVIPLARAKLLEQQIRATQMAASELHTEVGAPENTNSTVPHHQILHRVGIGELVRLGLISNRGMIAIGAAFYFLSQSNLLPANLFKSLGAWLRETIGFAHGWFFWLAFALLSIGLILIVVRLASIAMAIFSYYNFQLHFDGQRMRSEQGLLTRQGGSTKPEGIIAQVIQDGWLYRTFNRQSLLVVLPGSIAMSEDGTTNTAMRHLSPIAKPEVVKTLIQQASGLDVNVLQWNPLHPKAFSRMSKWPSIIWLSVAALAAFGIYQKHMFVGLLFAYQLQAAAAVFIVALLIIAFNVYGNWRDARASGWCLTDKLLCVRFGHFSQTTFFVDRTEVQSLSVRESPFDAAHQMADLHIDLRAGNPLEIPELKVRYLPKAHALYLARQLRRQVG